MSAGPTTRAARSLRRAEVPEVVRQLERDFGRAPGGGGGVHHQFLLDALDRGERDRFAVWPDEGVGAVAYVGTTGTVVPAGDPLAGAALAEAADGSSWRVLIGDAPLARVMVDAAARGIFRRRANAREQRFMVAEAVSLAAPPAGMRLAVLDDLPAVTQFACALHVEDLMGPPIPRASRAGVRARMRDSILRRSTWVVERGGRPVAKVDLSIRSRTRGAQIAGVYVDSDHRGGGIGGDLVAAVARTLLDEGLPAVTLHVRADNAPALRAYRRAGFADRGAWLLALR